MSGHTPEAYARLTQPLVRDPRDEPFRQADWEEALTRVAQGLSRARGAFGRFSRAHATYFPDGVDTDRKTNGANCPIVGTAEFRASAIRIEKLPVAAVRS
jgi:anaerobic selenocysteine-containing dehydrogenase